MLKNNGFHNRHSPILRAFSPLSLFSGGAPGVWYDPSDYGATGTLFQDSAGTTPVTAVEQPVGLMLDKSQGLVLGSEIANTSLSSWSPVSATVSVNSNVATVNATATEPMLLSPAITTVVGVTYRFVATLTKGTVTTNNAYLAATNNSNASGAFAFTPETGNGGGTITLYFRATATTTYVYARWGQAGVGTTFTVSNISVKELPGNHASQATSASRPVLKIDGNGKLYLKFDGVDDSLSTNSISFTSTDKMSVFAGVRKLSDAAAAIVAELSAVASTNNGAFYVAAPDSPATYGFGLRGTTSINRNASTYTAPITNVLAASFDIAQATPATELSIRINAATPGTIVNGGASDAGTGNFGNYPLFIGRRNNATLPFNGNLYSMIIVGKAVTSGELSSTETYVNQKTGAY